MMIECWDMGTRLMLLLYLLPQCPASSCAGVSHCVRARVRACVRAFLRACLQHHLFGRIVSAPLSVTRHWRVPEVGCKKRRAQRSWCDVHRSAMCTDSKSRNSLGYQRCDSCSQSGHLQTLPYTFLPSGFGPQSSARRRVPPHSSCVGIAIPFCTGSTGCSRKASGTHRGGCQAMFLMYSRTVNVNHTAPPSFFFFFGADPFDAPPGLEAALSIAILESHMAHMKTGSE
mmetsp:Transcript_65635/g.161594  ORF Transcript_65635/g.161594 Transcript_65635/m.161594 type:complete len:229 (-) Transcript_65635:502-1188(-)